MVNFVIVVSSVRAERNFQSNTFDPLDIEIYVNNTPVRNDIGSFVWGFAIKAKNSATDIEIGGYAIATPLGKEDKSFDELEKKGNMEGIDGIILDHVTPLLMLLLREMLVSPVNIQIKKKKQEVSTT